MTQDWNFSHRMTERIHTRIYDEVNKEDQFVRKENNNKTNIIINFLNLFGFDVYKNIYCIYFYILQ